MITSWNAGGAPTLWFGLARPDKLLSGWPFFVAMSLSHVVGWPLEWAASFPEGGWEVSIFVTPNKKNNKQSELLCLDE